MERYSDQRPMRLLLVEDDARLADLLVRSLREQGYAVDHATDGDAAIVQAAVNSYDAIVLDVMLPGLDGWVTQALYAPDGATLLTLGGGHAAHLWRTSDRSLLARLEVGETPTHAAFSRDGARLLIADARGQVQAVFPAQQPGLFGPRFRRPLGLDEQLPAGELFHVEHAPDGPPILLAGPARDLHPDDEFDLLDLATTTYGPADILATARPADLRVDRCRLVPDAGPLPRRNCYARRSRRGRPPALDLRPLLGHPLHAPLRARLPELGLVPADDTPRPCIGRLEPARARLLGARHAQEEQALRPASARDALSHVRIQELPRPRKAHREPLRP